MPTLESAAATSAADSAVGTNGPGAAVRPSASRATANVRSPAP